MRIISGCRRGMLLKAPKGEKTRPTEDRIKENIFNLIGPLFEEIVLDCFAGSGALGIEAVSRGAESALFYEPDREAFSVIKTNIQKTGFQDQCDLRNEDAIKGLSTGDLLPPFTLVFLDPPYNREDLYQKAFHLLSSRNLVAPEGTVVVERREDISFSVPEDFTLEKAKRYRNTVIEIWRRKV